MLFRSFEGGSLLPAERQGLYSVATSMVKQRQAQLQPDIQNYKSLATNLGGTGDYIKDPFADVFNPKIEKQEPITDWSAIAKAEIAKRKRGGQ